MKRPPIFIQIFVIAVILLVIGSVGVKWWQKHQKADAKLQSQLDDATLAIKQLANEHVVEKYDSVEGLKQSDPWGETYRIEYHTTGHLAWKKYYMTIRSYGPDGKRNTADDLKDERLLE